MVDDEGTDLRDPAFWDRLAHRDPAAALSAAAGAANDLDPRVAALALNTRARCLFELGELDAAAHAIAAAVDAAGDAVADEIGLSLAATTAVVMAERGEVDAALSMLDRLATGRDGTLLGRVHGQRAYVLQHAGRLHEALEQLELAERLLRDDSDVLRILSNRGLVLLQQGRLDAAQSDLEDAASMAAALGMGVIRAQCAANLGVLHGRARRLQQALASFDRARELFDVVGAPARAVIGMELDRVEVLLYSGLVIDAVESARRTVARIERTGNRVQAGDGALLLARAHLAAGQLRSARDVAAHAAAIFRSTARPHLVPHARSVHALAVLRRGAPDEIEAELAATRDLVAEIEAAGWEREALELSLARVIAAHRCGRLDDVREDLDHLRLGCFSGRRDLALPGWSAEAIWRSHGGGGSVLDACRHGLELVDEIVAEADSLEQRSAAMHMGEDLSQVAIDVAIELGDADTVLAAAEGTRARALHEELQEQRPRRPLTDEAAVLLRRELAARLGDRTLVEWVVSGGDVWAVVFDARGSRLVRVATVREIVRARDRVLVWLDLAATDPESSSERASRAAAVLDELLLAPLGLAPGAGVVVVPVGPLHGIPWSGLPTFADRPASVVPNAQLWLHADRRSAGAARAVGVVVGPDIVSAEVERTAITEHHPGAAVAAGPGATVTTVRSMFGGHDLVHVAAHGRFRSDRPLLSTLLLHEGEQTLGDVIPPRIEARLVVLTSCEGGAQGVADGAEVLGLSSVLLARGAASVVAPLSVVRDLECADFAAELHGELAAGEPVACALANVRRRWLADHDLSRWAVASSFACFGSGAATVAT